MPESTPPTIIDSMIDFIGIAFGVGMLGTLFCGLLIAVAAHQHEKREAARKRKEQEEWEAFVESVKSEDTN